MKRKPKEETRWCIEYPNGGLRTYKTYALRKLCIDNFMHDWHEEDWKVMQKAGYKCVKIKIRRA